jgi:hypothetical protein
MREVSFQRGREDVNRRRQANLRIGPVQAVQALSVLVSEGKIAARELYSALKRREKLIRDLRDRLAALERFTPFPMKPGSVKRAAREVSRKAKRRISAATRAAWAAQGRYMAAVRRLPKAARVKIKAIREKSGVAAAIAAAKRMAS